MDGLLEGRVMVVSGAGPGVGRAVALAAAREGAKVAVAARDKDRLDQIVEDVAAAGGEALAVVADVCDLDSCAELGRRVIDEFGAIHAVVNAAFWTEPERGLAETDEETWHRCLDVNVIGTWRVLHALSPLLSRPEGSIVTIGSQAGVKPSATLAVYAAAKAAVASLTASAALQLGPGIRVNGILPGSINGPGLHAWAERRAAERGTSLETELGDRIRRSPLGRIVTPREIAEAAVFLCSDRAGGITGSFIDLDCGQHLTA